MHFFLPHKQNPNAEFIRKGVYWIILFVYNFNNSRRASYITPPVVGGVHTFFTPRIQ